MGLPNQHQILHLLHSLCQQQGKTVVVSLHDLNLAAAYCDSLLLMRNGEMVASGPPSEVLNAELLSTVFRVPCNVYHSNSRATRIEFNPPFTEFQQNNRQTKYES